MFNKLYNQYLKGFENGKTPQYNTTTTASKKKSKKKDAAPEKKKLKLVFKMGGQVMHNTSLYYVLIYW